jgi:predicted nucleic acid-binding protein
MARKWVVNASPLIILGKLSQLSLLSRIPDDLVIPRAVAEEVTLGPPGDAAREWVEKEGAALVHESGPVDTEVAAWDLGLGESHVLTWARRHPQTTAILDDAASRRCAEALGIQITGTLGVLVMGKRAGLLSELKPILSEAQSKGFRISPDILNTALHLAGESLRSPEGSL